MKAEAITALIKGLKSAGIDFVATLPSSAFTPVIPHIMRDPYFKHVPVGNESDGVVICAGAWMGGKKPALMMENTGVVVSAHDLSGLECQYGGFPMLLIVDHRGSFGDGAAYFYFASGQVAPIVLDTLKIPYIIVRDSEKLPSEIVSGQKTAEAYGKPVAVLFSEEEKL